MTERVPAINMGRANNNTCARTKMKQAQSCRLKGKSCFSGFSFIEVLIASLILSFTLFAMIHPQHQLMMKLLQKHQVLENLIKQLNAHEKSMAHLA